MSLSLHGAWSSGTSSLQYELSHFDFSNLFSKCFSSICLSHPLSFKTNEEKKIESFIRCRYCCYYFPFHNAMFIRFDLGSTFFALANWCTLTISSSNSSSFKNLWDGGMLGNCMVAENERERKWMWSSLNALQLHSASSIDWKRNYFGWKIHLFCVRWASVLAGWLLDRVSENFADEKWVVCTELFIRSVSLRANFFALLSPPLYLYSIGTSSYHLFYVGVCREHRKRGREYHTQTNQEEKRRPEMDKFHGVCVWLFVRMFL